MTLLSVRAGFKHACSAAAGAVWAAIGCYLPSCRVRDILALWGLRLPL